MHRNRGRFRSRARGRRRGRGSSLYVRSIGMKEASSPKNPEESQKEEHEKKMDPVAETILHRLKYSTQRTYGPKHIVWVKLESNEWFLSIVKYVLHDGDFIVRPLCEAPQSEFTIRPDQIYGVPPSLSLQKLQNSITQIKDELAHVYDDDEREIFQGTLVRYNKSVFAEVLEHHSKENTYTIKIRNECKAYIGPVVVRNVKHKTIQISNEAELKNHILRQRIKKQMKPSIKDKKRNWHSDNGRELHLYDFLEEMGDLYMKTFLTNGVTSVKVALCLTESDLKEMKIKLGHRRFIMKLIQNFDPKKKYDPKKFANSGAQSYDNYSHGYSSDNRRNTNNMSRNLKIKNEHESKLIIYGFNRTITVKNLGYDNNEMQPGAYKGTGNTLKEMSDEKMVSIFGGTERIERLQKHFEYLLRGNVQLAIVSFTYTSVIKAALKRVRLFDDYFAKATIIGGDNIAMQLYHGNKAVYIKNTFKDSDYNPTDILLVDDTATIEQATNLKACKSLLVKPNSGITEEHMFIIENMYKQPKKNVNTEQHVTDGYDENNDDEEGVSQYSKK